MTSFCACKDPIERDGGMFTFTRQFVLVSERRKTFFLSVVNFVLSFNIFSDYKIKLHLHGTPRHHNTKGRTRFLYDRPELFAAFLKLRNEADDFWRGKN